MTSRPTPRPSRFDWHAIGVAVILACSLGYLACMWFTIYVLTSPI